MKIFIAHSSSYNFTDELYRPLKSSALNNEHAIFYPHDFGFGKVTKSIVEDHDIVVAEASLPSTGQGIEIGWATAANIPVVCIYKKGSTPSGALPFVTKEFIEYTSPDDMVEKLSRYLSRLSEK